jgi:hypothetical protein
MLSEEKLQQIVFAIHNTPGLRNTKVLFIGNGQCRVLYEPKQTIYGNESRIMVVLEEVPLSDGAVIGELERWARGNGESPPSSPSPIVATNRSRLGPELIGAGVSCGLTIVAAASVVGGVAAEIPTAGASTFLVYAGWVGLATSGIQCLNGLVRVGEIARSPDDDSLERWENNAACKYSILVVDGIGVASGFAALPSQARNLYAILSRQRAFAARGLTFQSLRAMNRAERLRVITELFGEAARTPQGRDALLQAAREAGITRDLHAMSGLSVQRSKAMMQAISVETSRRLTTTVRDILSTAIGTTGSAMSDETVGSASGSVNEVTTYVLNVVEMAVSAQRSETTHQKQQARR